MPEALSTGRFSPEQAETFLIGNIFLLQSSSYVFIMNEKLVLQCCLTMCLTISDAFFQLQKPDSMKAPSAFLEKVKTPRLFAEQHTWHLTLLSLEFQCNYGHLPNHSEWKRLFLPEITTAGNETLRGWFNLKSQLSSLSFITPPHIESWLSGIDSCSVDRLSITAVLRSMLRLTAILSRLGWSIDVVEAGGRLTVDDESETDTGTQQWL